MHFLFADISSVIVVLNSVEGVKYTDSEGEHDEEEEVGEGADRLRPAVDHESTARSRPAHSESTARRTGEDKTITSQQLIFSGTKDILR